MAVLERLVKLFQTLLYDGAKKNLAGVVERFISLVLS